jgi:dTDP-4-amino-4,6-dideoxygalactose transaminase
MLLVSSAIVGEEEKAALAEVIASGWLTMGEKVRVFEEAFAVAHGAEDSVGVSSCTAALHLILLALGVGPGDEVLVPSLTFVATVNAVLYVGATPVFVDIESTAVPLISVTEAEAQCTSRTKAAILVHFAGYLADRDAWHSLARRKNLMLIEDAAHAPGLKEVGTYGEAAAFSFYGNKNMTMGEGGAVIARDPALLQKIRQARGHGMTSGTYQRLNSRSPTYDVTMLGFNYRMDELHAAVGLVQLGHLQAWNAKRAELTSAYRKLTTALCPEILVPFDNDWLSAHHILPVLLPEGFDRQMVVDDLRTRGIQTTIHYTPVHTLTLYRGMFPLIALGKTETFARRELTLPLHPKMTAESVSFVVEALTASVSKELRTLDAA